MLFVTGVYLRDKYYKHDFCNFAFEIWMWVIWAFAVLVVCLLQSVKFCLVLFAGQSRCSGRVHERLHNNHAITHGACSQHRHRPLPEAFSHSVTWPHYTGVGCRDSAAAVRLQRSPGVSHHHLLSPQSPGLCLWFWEWSHAGLQCAVHVSTGGAQVSSFCRSA